MLLCFWYLSSLVLSIFEKKTGVHSCNFALAHQVHQQKDYSIINLGTVIRRDKVTSNRDTRVMCNILIVFYFNCYRYAIRKGSCYVGIVYVFIIRKIALHVFVYCHDQLFIIFMFSSKKISTNISFVFKPNNLFWDKKIRSNIHANPLKVCFVF